MHRSTPGTAVRFPDALSCSVHCHTLHHPPGTAMQAEPLITWPEPIWEYVNFGSEFASVGAVGFCYAAVRGRARGDGTEAWFYSRALSRAAIVGLVAQVVQAFLFWR